MLDLHVSKKVRKNRTNHSSINSKNLVHTLYWNSMQRATSDTGLKLGRAFNIIGREKFEVHVYLIRNDSLYKIDQRVMMYIHKSPAMSVKWLYAYHRNR